MSISIFAQEASKQTTFLDKLDSRIMKAIPGDSFEDQLKRSKMRLAEMNKFCAQHIGSSSEESDNKSIKVQDFDGMRQSMVQRLIYVPENRAEKANMDVIAESEGSNEDAKRMHSPQRRTTYVKNFGSGRRSGKKGSKKREEKKFSIRVLGEDKSFNDIRKRNSAIISKFGGGPGGKKSMAVPKKSAFALPSLNPLGGKSQRDSIDVSSRNSRFQRPSTLVQLRNSTFNFNSGLVFNNNDLLVQEEDLNDVYSELSDCEFDAEPAVFLEENAETKVRVLRCQYLQHDKRFIEPSENYPFNVNVLNDEIEIDEDQEQSKLSIRTIWFPLLTPCMTINHYSKGGRVLENGIKLINGGNGQLIKVESEEDLALLLEEDEGKGVEYSSLEVDNLIDFEIQTIPRLKKGIRYIGTALADHGALPKYSISLVDQYIMSHKLNEKFVKTYLKTTKLFTMRENQQDDTVAIKALRKGSVTFNIETGRQKTPLLLTQGVKIKFNEIDGIRVDGVLDGDYSEQDLKNFIPTKNAFVNCLNSDPLDKSIFKYLCLKLMSDEDRKKNLEHLNLSLDNFLSNAMSSKSRIMKLTRSKNKFLMKEALKNNKPPMIKITLIRDYKELNMTKVMATFILFQAKPIIKQGETKVIGQVLKSSIFRDCNSILLGGSLQRSLPVLRTDFEKINPLLNINTEYDMMIGYERELNQFFFLSDASLSLKKGVNLSYENLCGLKETKEGEKLQDFTDLLKPVISKSALNLPKEGPWIELERNTLSTLPSSSLISAGNDIFRLFNEELSIVKPVEEQD